MNAAISEKLLKRTIPRKDSRNRKSVETIRRAAISKMALFIFHPFCYNLSMRTIRYSEKQCEKCKGQFIPTSPKQKWCFECLTKKCLVCGKDFFIGKKTKFKTAKFCSRKCQGKYVSMYRTGENAYHYKTGNSCKKVEVKCSWCKQVFLMKQGQALKNINHFCSTKCYAEYQKKYGPKGEEHPKYCKVETTCEWCGKTFLTTPSTIKKVRFCGKQCRNNWQSEMMSGENHHNWKGGIAGRRSIMMASREYKEWRHKVFSRDKYTCQLCKDDKGGNLRAHHIQPVALRPDLVLDVDNGITLCNNCHESVHYG